jgi:hypothetical protein
MNTCKYCNLIGEESLFRSKNICKECNNKNAVILSRRYRKDNKEIISNRAKIYYELNKEKKRQSKKKYYENNKERLKEKQRVYNKTHKEQISKSKKLYTPKRNELNKIKYKTDNLFRINRLIKRGFLKGIKTYSKTGKTKALKEYGINIRAIVEKLGEPPKDGKEWHIDHVLPVSAFDLTKPEHIKACWHPDNLRWLEASENIKKSNKYDKEEFEKYLNEHIEVK